MVCPVSFIEPGPAFGGDESAANAFLNAAGIGTGEPWTWHDTAMAHRLWNDFHARRRQTVLARRPVADVIIAAFASRFQGIITGNASDFRNILPTLAMVEP